MNIGEKFGLPAANKEEEQKQSEQNPKLNFGGVANLFGEQPQKEKSDENQIIYLSPNDLISFKDHPFSLHTGKRKQDLVDSIKEHGILSPILVREKESGYYEILAGHNRVEAGKEAGIDKIPCIVMKEITEEEEAMLIVVESNLMQRSFFDMKESEKAAVLYYRHEVMKKKNTGKEMLEEIENLLQMTESADPSGKTREKVGKEYDLSGRTISRYLRIYECIPALKELLDEDKIGIYVAVALSYLSGADQETVAKKIENGEVISVKKAEELKAQSQQLTAKKIEEILSGEKEDTEKEKKGKGAKVILSKETTQKYFEGKNATEVAEIIERALEQYFNEMRG